MMTKRSIAIWLFAAAVLAGCTKSSTGMSPEPAPTPAKPTPAPDPQPEVMPTPKPTPSFSVEIASVTLADQCGQGSAIKPPIVKPATPAVQQAPAKPAKTAAGGAPGAAARRACEQTSMQLALKAPAADKVTVKKVELLDDNLINELAARDPAKWSGGAYAAWDEQLAAGDDIVVAYALGAPDWNKIGGRYAANAKTFQLRVTLAIGTAEQVIVKQAISAAHMEPAVPT